MRLWVTAVVLVVAWCAAAVVAQNGLAEGAVFQPLILPRAQVRAHSRLPRLPVYPKAHWEDPRLRWAPANTKPAAAAAATATAATAAPAAPTTREQLVTALDAAAAAGVASNAANAPATMNAFAAQSAWERDAEAGIRTLAQAVHRNSQVIANNRETSDKLKALAVRIASQLKEDEVRLNQHRAAMSQLQANAAQRTANKLAIKTLVRRVDDATKAIKAIVAVVGLNRQHIATDETAGSARAKAVDGGVLTLAKLTKTHGQTLQRHSQRLEELTNTMAGLQSATLARKLAKVVVAMGLEAKALKHDETLIRQNTDAVNAVNAVQRTSASARAKLRDALQALLSRSAALERVSAEHKQLVAALRAEVDGVKAGDASRDRAIKALQTQLAAVEKRAHEAELDANDAHHKADAAADMIAALQHSHKATESALQANVAATSAAADRLAAANSVSEDHSRRLTEIVAELTALSKRVDTAESAAARARVSTATQIAHNTAVANSNAARAAAVATNTASAEKALADLQALSAKLAVVESTLKSQSRAADAARATAAQQRKQLSAAVGALQQRSAATEARSAQTAKVTAALAKAQQQQAAAARARAAAQARAVAQAKAKAQAQAQAQAKAKAVAVAQARAIAVARARAAQHQQQLRAKQSQAAAVQRKLAAQRQAQRAAVAKGKAKAKGNGKRKSQSKRGKGKGNGKGKRKGKKF